MSNVPGEYDGVFALGDRVSVKGGARNGRVVELLGDGRLMVQADPAVVAGGRSVASPRDLTHVALVCPGGMGQSENLLDRLARLLNEFPPWKSEAICRELAEELSASGREILDGSLSEKRNKELSVAEHHRANAQAAYLVGKRVRSSDGVIWKVHEWDAVGKDGWATIGDGAGRWDRPEQVEVIGTEVEDPEKDGWIEIACLSTDEADRLIAALRDPVVDPPTVRCLGDRIWSRRSSRLPNGSRIRQLGIRSPRATVEVEAPNGARIIRTIDSYDDAREVAQIAVLWDRPGQIEDRQ
jgi:hypothetical protein